MKIDDNILASKDVSILLIEDKKIITNKGSYTQMQQAKKERQAVAEKIWNKNKNKKNINKKINYIYFSNLHMLSSLLFSCLPRCIFRALLPPL